MARELIIKIKCDFCKTEISEDEAYPGEMIFLGKTYGVDLCEQDYAELIGKLTPKAKALVQGAAPTGQQKQYPSNKKGKVLPCPACGHLVKNELGLKFHIKKMHPGSEYTNMRS
jgi:hypothetical protein